MPTPRRPRRFWVKGFPIPTRCTEKACGETFVRPSWYNLRSLLKLHPGCMKSLHFVTEVLAEQMLTFINLRRNADQSWSILYLYCNYIVPALPRDHHGSSRITQISGCSAGQVAIGRKHKVYILPENSRTNQIWTRMKHAISKHKIRSRWLKGYTRYECI